MPHYYFIQFDDSFNEFQDTASSLEKRGFGTIPTIDPEATEDDKRKAFRSILRTLSSLNSEEELGDEDVTSCIVFFESLYGGSSKFRHRYSDVCEIMFGYLSSTGDLDKVVPYQVDKLCNGVGMILEVANREHRMPDMINALSKLQDHVELERHRMNYMASQNQAQKKSATNLTVEFNQKIAKGLKEADEKNREELENTKDRLQKNYVTILGIFASIVIAFMSATAFSSSVLQSMAFVSIYRLSFTMLVLGFFVFNLLGILFMFLSQFSKGSPRMGKYMAYVDIVFVILIAAVVFARLTNMLAFF